MSLTPPSDDSFDFEAERARSNTYEPKVSGPLIDIQRPSLNVVTEYQNGHPTHRAKAATLARDYPFIRNIRGDGNCGYRAIFFGYLEVLLRLRDTEKLHAEAIRIQSLDNLVRTYLTRPGEDFSYIQDFLDPAFELVRDMPELLSKPDQMQLLFEAFEQGMDAYYVQYLRYLASAWIQHKADVYVNFIEGLTVDQYCSDQVEPVKVEIDNIALQALYEVLIQPAGFDLQVLYLDLSPGDAVTVHKHSQTQVPENRVIRLLYRPGHYDLIYKEPEPFVQ